MPNDAVITYRRDENLIICLNRPEKRNALNDDIMAGLRDAFESVHADPDVRCVIIRGEGKGFSSGADYFALAGTGILDETAVFARRLIRRMQNIVNLVSDLEKPVICALHGFCFGMAVELALAADFRIAQKGTRLAVQEVEMGFIPDVGGTTRLTHLLGPVKAKELIMTARIVEAEEARDIQLVNDVVDDAMEGALALAARLNKNAPLAVGLAKRLINRCQHMDQRTFMEMEAIAQSTLIWTQDVKEGLMAKMEKREPNFKGK